MSAQKGWGRFWEIRNKNLNIVVESLLQSLFHVE